MHQTDTNHESNDEKAYNVFRNSFLRYAGYANEVGESFRYQFPRLVLPSYGIAFGYCFADAVSDGYSSYYYRSQIHRDSGGGEEGDNRSSTSSDLQRAATACFDTLLWQSLASVMIPGCTINTLVRLARYAIPKSPVKLPTLAIQWFPTAIGLFSIPIIIHPIDNAVDYLLDNTTRPYMRMINQQIKSEPSQ
jgi:fission process protein 1